MFKHLLVPLDGSKLAEQAIAPALLIAKQCNAAVTFARVPVPRVDRVGQAGGLSWLTDEQMQQEAIDTSTTYLNNAVNDFAEDLPVKVAVPIGQDAAEALIDFIDTQAVDLVVMSSHGRTGVLRWAYGSVAHRLITHAPTTVLVLRNHHKIQKMLMTVDGSKLSESIIEPGRAIAKSLSLPVTLFYATGRSFEIGESDVLDKPEQYLRNIATEFIAEEIECSTMIKPGHPASAIVDYAEESATDLIAMATHGRSGYTRWQFGSVTNQVMNSKATSMLIVRRR